MQHLQSVASAFRGIRRHSPAYASRRPGQLKLTGPASALWNCAPMDRSVPYSQSAAGVSLRSNHASCRRQASSHLAAFHGLTFLHNKPYTKTPPVIIPRHMPAEALKKNITLRHPRMSYKVIMQTTGRVTDKAARLTRFVRKEGEGYKQKGGHLTATAPPKPLTHYSKRLNLYPTKTVLLRGNKFKPISPQSHGRTTHNSRRAKWYASADSGVFNLCAASWVSSTLRHSGALWWVETHLTTTSLMRSFSNPKSNIKRTSVQPPASLRTGPLHIPGNP